MKTFFDMFDKKRFFSVFKIIFLLLLFILAINSLDITYSRYESGAISNAKAKVAFYVMESGTYEQSISLSDIIPSDDEYIICVINILLLYKITKELVEQR